MMRWNRAQMLWQKCFGKNIVGNGQFFIRQRPYHVESTGSRPITEVKQRRARLVLGWVTAWEPRVLLASHFAPFPKLYSALLQWICLSKDNFETSFFIYAILMHVWSCHFASIVFSDFKCNAVFLAWTPCVYESWLLSSCLHERHRSSSATVLDCTEIRTWFYSSGYDTWALSFACFGHL